MKIQPLHILTIPALLILTAAPSLAQSTPGKGSIALSYSFNRWKTDFKDFEDKLSQGAFILSSTYYASEQLRFDLTGTHSSAKYSISDQGGELSFSTLNDTRLRGTYFFRDNIASGSLSLNLPTGKKKLSEGQYLLSVLFADNSMRFPVRRFGQGFDVGTDWFYYPRTGSVEFQVGGGYLVKGSYQPTAYNDAKYKYGNELYGLGGLTLDREIVTLSASIVFKTYGKDKYNSKTVFQSGKTLILSGGLRYHGDVNLALGASLYSRGKAKALSVENGDLDEEKLKSGRNEILLYAVSSAPIGGSVEFLGRADYHWLGENEYDPEDFQYRPKSNYVGLGAGLGVAVSPAVSVTAMGNYYVGTVDEDFDLKGLSIMTVLSVRY